MGDFKGEPREALPLDSEHRLCRCVGSKQEAMTTFSGNCWIYTSIFASVHKADLNKSLMNDH